MKLKIIGLLFFILLIILFGLSLRGQVKQRLPRTGEIKVVGGVYTPYLLLDSALYFLKGWDESIDFALTRNFSEKARFELIFANKRLLEMEKLARQGNYNFVPRLTESHLRSLRKASAFAQTALERGENVEELTWLFQESLQDHQNIFETIISESPEEKRDDFLSLQKQSSVEIKAFLKRAHGLDNKEFQ